MELLLPPEVDTNTISFAEIKIRLWSQQTLETNTKQSIVLIKPIPLITVYPK